MGDTVSSKNVIDLAIGAEVDYAGETCVIHTHLSLSSFLLKKRSSGEMIVAQLDDLAPVHSDEPSSSERPGDIIRLSTTAWQKAKQREAVIRPLEKMTAVTTAQADEAAQQLGISQRSVYALIKRYRDTNGLLTSLIRRPPSGGRGKKRLAQPIE